MMICYLVTKKLKFDQFILRSILKWLWLLSFKLNMIFNPYRTKLLIFEKF